MSNLVPFRARSSKLRLGQILYSDRRMAVLNKYPGAEAQVGLTSLRDAVDVGCTSPGTMFHSPQEFGHSQNHEPAL